MSVPTSAPAPAVPLTPTIVVAGPVSPYVAYAANVQPQLYSQVFGALTLIGNNYAAAIQTALMNPDYATANQKAQDAGTTTDAMQQQRALTSAEIAACKALADATAATFSFARAATKIAGYVAIYADSLAGFTETSDVENYKNTILAEPGISSLLGTYLPKVESVLEDNEAVVVAWRTVIH